MIFLSKNKINKIINNKILILLLILFIFKINSVNADSVEDSQAKVSKESVVALVNSDRAKEGKKQLIENEILDRVAESKLSNMIEDDYFAHTSPKGVDPWEWFSKEGYRFEYAGENLAMNFTNATDQHKAWMDSLAHRENILNENFTDIGVAIREKTIDEKIILVTVQVFGTPEEKILSSPNFTPQTLMVPTEIVYANLDNVDNLNFNKPEKKQIVKGEFSKANFLEENLIQISTWFILIAVTGLIFGVEYKFFKKNK